MIFSSLRQLNDRSTEPLYVLPTFFAFFNANAITDIAGPVCILERINGFSDVPFHRTDTSNHHSMCIATKRSLGEGASAWSPDRARAS